MISLLEIAQSINEADDDKYTSIGFGRFKLKGKEDDDDADVYVKTDSGKYVKSSDQKSDDDGGKKPEEPQGGKLGGSDFERDFDDKGDEPKGDEEPKKLSSDEIDKKIKDLGDEIRNIYQSGMSPQDSERYIDGLQKQIDDLKSQKGGDDNAESDDKKTSESENEKIISSIEDIATDIYGGYNVDSEDSAIDDGQYAVISAADSGNPDNEMSVNAFPDGNDVGYGINVGTGHKMIYFDSKEEALEAAKKLLKNSRIRAAMDARSEETLADLGDHAESVLKSKDETININLKEKYDRIFRSLK